MLNKLKQNKKYIIVGTVIIAVFSTIAYFMLNNSYASGTPITEPSCIKTSLGDTKSKEIEIIDAPILTEEEGIDSYPIKYSIENTCDEMVNYDILIELNRITNIETNKINIAHNNEISKISNLDLVDREDIGYKMYKISSETIPSKSKVENEFRLWQSSTNSNTNVIENTISVKLIIR